MLEEKARLDEANFVAKNKKMTLEMEEIRAQLEEKKKALVLKSKDMSAKESKLLEWQRELEKKLSEMEERDRNFWKIRRELRKNCLARWHVQMHLPINWKKKFEK